MGIESLINAERAAGFAMATSEDLLGIRPVVTSRQGPVPMDRHGPSPKDVVKRALDKAPAKSAAPRSRSYRLSLLDYLPSWTTAKA